MALLDQLFGQQKPQDDGGLVQSILSQRFQPSQNDAAQAMLQTATTAGRFVNPSEVMSQRLAPGMNMATQLAALQQQGAQTEKLGLENEMQRFQMPLIQQQMRQLYGDTGAAPVGFPAQAGGAGGQPMPQDNSAPSGNAPVGFNNTPKDPRIKMAETAALMGNKPLSEAYMADYNADPNVIKRKEQMTTEGKNTAENQLLASKADELTQRLGMNLNAMLQLNPNVPSGGIVPAEAKTYMSQALGANKDNAIGGIAGAFGADTSGNGAMASNQWDQINNQQILSEIQQFIATGGANTRTNQTLEKIVRAASGIDKNSLPQSREAQIRNALSEIHNKNVSAGNLAGGKQPYENIPVNVPGASQGQPQSGGAPQGGRIRIMTPDGQPGTIDAAHLQDLIAAGGRQMQ